MQESTEEILFRVKEFTDKAHGDQMRKYSPDRYIVHPVRVMELCREYTSDICVLSAAVMHDVLEDTPVRKIEIQEFLEPILGKEKAKRTVNLVVELSDVYVKKDYPHMNRRKRKSLERERMSQTSPDAQTIKYADILDNCREIVEHDPDFAKVFLTECRKLLEVMNDGNHELLQKSREEVNKGLIKLGRKSDYKNK